MDKQLFQDQIGGLQKSIESLRDTERKLIKYQTLTEQIEKARVKSNGSTAKLADVKRDKSGLLSKKESSLSRAADMLSLEITELLPEGLAVFKIKDGDVLIGWKNGDSNTPYLGLSGGERAFFDIALSKALLGKSKEKILIGEIAEVDNKNTTKQLRSISRQHPDCQIILNTCHPIKEIPKEWKVIQL